MNTSLLILRVRCKRDVVVARQRARQVASVLGFAAGEQACIAAAVFALARQAFALDGSVAIHFEIEQDALQIFPRRRAQAIEEAPPLRLKKPLPVREDTPVRDDLPWIIGELVRRTPANVFEEIHCQNQEMLAALVELREYRARLLQAVQGETTAA